MTHSTSEKLPAEDVKQADSVFRVAAIVEGAALVVLFFYLFLSWQLKAWQMLGLTGAVAVFVAAGAWALYLIRRGRVETGGWILVIGVIAIFPAATLLIANIGVIFGAVLVILTVSVASQTLPAKSARLANIIAVGAGLLTGLLELLPLTYRLEVPAIQTFVPAITGVMVVLIVFFAIRQSWGRTANFLRASIRNRLTVIVVGAAIIPVVLISLFLGWVTYVQVQSALTKDAFDKLAAVETIKANQVSSYLAERQGDMLALSETLSSIFIEARSKMEAVNALKTAQIHRLFQVWDADVRDVSADPGVVAGMRTLDAGFKELGAGQVRALYLGQEKLPMAGDGSAYSAAHLEQQDFFGGYTAIHGYEDAFLIDTAGNVIYSVHKTEVFGTNLMKGPYQASGLAGLYQNLLTAPAGKTYVADVTLFGERQTMFIGAPIYDGATLVGILAYQLPLDVITKLVAERTGVGATGETYLVAQEPDGRITYRSDRVTAGNGKFVVGYDLTSVATQFMRNALAGQTGGGLAVGSTGEAVINAYSPLGVEGLHWAVLSRVAASEALSPLHAGETKDFLTSYKENYGYYDIFLIEPNGQVFYSAAKEAEYQTNLLTGKYKDTNLGQLIAEVGESKAFEFADFAAYAPTGGKPAAFFAIPVLNPNDRQVQMILAAQVSQEQLNAIMGETIGLGQTGETFLVGQDKLRRTESRFLADLGAETTILNPNFKVDTVASRGALAGESGQQVFTDYRGVSVLGVWSPISIAEATASRPEAQVWGLIAKIDAAEALAPVNQLAGALALSIGLAVLVVGALAVLVGARFAVGFVTPILTLTSTATQVAAGDMTLTVQTDSVDEIGTLTQAFNSMTSQLRDLIGSLEGRVAARTKDLAIVAEVGTATATILETDKLLQEVVNLTKERFNLYHSHIYLLDEAGENLVLASGAGEPGRLMKAAGLSIPLNREQSLVARAAREAQGVTVNDVTLAPDFLPNPLLPETRSELAVPMIVGGRVIGVFDIQSEQVGRFTDSDVNIQTTLAAQVATSLQNVRSFEQSKSQADLETLVNAIGQKIQRAATVEDTLQVAIREVGLALGASRVSISVGVQANSQPEAAASLEVSPSPRPAAE
jgi:methyl-accepting chemotaxis protein